MIVVPIEVTCLGEKGIESVSIHKYKAFYPKFYSIYILIWIFFTTIVEVGLRYFLRKRKTQSAARIATKYV